MSSTVLHVRNRALRWLAGLALLSSAFTAAPALASNDPVPNGGALPSAQQWKHYDRQLTATGGVTPYSWTATGLPVGLQVDSLGDIFGVPEQAGTSSVVAEVTDSAGTTATVVRQLTVVAVPAGRLYAWGDNTDYALGDGTTVNRQSPVGIDVPDVSAVAIGSDGAMALSADGTVWAWGENTDGQLGNGMMSANPATHPQHVPNLAHVVAIAASDSSRYALTASGKVLAWGDNFDEQLGDGGQVDSAVPQPVPGLTSVVAIAAGEGFADALKGNGTVFGWGENVFGLIWPWFGPGPLPGSAVPVQLPYPKHVSSIAAGPLNSYAVIGGEVWAIGYGEYGALGNGGYVDTGDNAVRVLGLTAASLVAADASTAYAILPKLGEVRAWGDNTFGGLGNGSAVTGTDHPVGGSGLTGVTAIAGNGEGAMVLRHGKILAWGDNSNGQFGNGTLVSSPVPVQGPSLSGVIAIAGSYGEGFAIG